MFNQNDATGGSITAQEVYGSTFSPFPRRNAPLTPLAEASNNQTAQMSGSAAISWIGIVVAAIILRIIIEFA